MKINSGGQKVVLTTVSVHSIIRLIPSSNNNRTDRITHDIPRNKKDKTAQLKNLFTTLRYQYEKYVIFV